MRIENKDIFGNSGFCIRPQIKRADSAKIKTLSKYPVAVIGDGLSRRSKMDVQIKPLSSAMRTFGSAITVETRPGDNLMIHAALKVAKPGDVLVVKGHGFKSAAVWGILMASSAVKIGLAGIIVDGAVIDSQAIAKSSLPTFSRWLCSEDASNDGPGQVNMPIFCGGITVSPGDIIIGDDNGVIVINKDLIDEAIQLAENKQTLKHNTNNHR